MVSLPGPFEAIACHAAGPSEYHSIDTSASTGYMMSITGPAELSAAATARQLLEPQCQPCRMVYCIHRADRHHEFL